MTDRPQDAFRDYLDSQVMRPVRTQGTISVADAITAITNIVENNGGNKEKVEDISQFAALLRGCARMPIINNQKNRETIDKGLAGLQYVPVFYNDWADQNSELPHMREVAGSVNTTVNGIVSALTKLFEEHYPISQMKR